MAAERLQKILARAGIASRRKAEELITAGLVTINGRVAVLGDKADAGTDSIKIDGKRVPPAVPHRYLVLNKPAGYVSTVSDPERRPTVIDLVHPSLRKALMPVGRLDFQSEGLILLTTDGEWAQRIAHPRYGCAKVYEAKVKGLPEAAIIERLRRGMWIDGKRTLPAEVRLLRTTGRGRETGNSWWEVVLREGRSRQIREMFFRVAHGVQKLKRVAIGPLRDDNLPLGGWRELSEGEVEGLRKAGKTTAKHQGRKADEEPRGEAEGRVPARPSLGRATGAAERAAMRASRSVAAQATREAAGAKRPERPSVAQPVAAGGRPRREGAATRSKREEGAATARPKRDVGPPRPRRATAAAAPGAPPAPRPKRGPGAPPGSRRGGSGAGGAARGAGRGGPRRPR